VLVTSTISFNIGLKGAVKPRSSLGFVVGSEIEVSWELTNLGATTFPGGILHIVMATPNGQFVEFIYTVRPMNSGRKVLIDRNPDGSPLRTNVLAQGFTLFLASMDNAVLWSPPGRILPKGYSFHSFLGKSKEEIYSKFALIVAVAGLVGTFITSVIQLLLTSGILRSF
jgi:hypothetical protein